MDQHGFGAAANAMATNTLLPDSKAVELSRTFAEITDILTVLEGRDLLVAAGYVLRLADDVKEAERLQGYSDEHIRAVATDGAETLYQQNSEMLIIARNLLDGIGRAYFRTRTQPASAA
jgi:hypothetical protein